MEHRITFRMSPQELARLDSFAADHDMTRSEVVRRAITARIREVRTQ